MLGQSAGDCGGAVFQGFDFHKARPAHRQSARLIKGHGVRLGQSFERRTVLHHDALPEEFTRGDNLDHGHGKTQCTWAGNDKDRYGDQHGLFPVSAQEAPGKERDQRQQMHDRGVECCSAIGDPAIASSSALGGFHQADDLGEKRILGNSRRPQHQRAGQIHCPRTHFAVAGNGDGAAFAGDDGEVHVAFSADDYAIDGNPFARGYRDFIPRRDLFYSNVTSRPVRMDQQCSAWGKSCESVDRRPSLFPHHMIESSANQQEEEQRDRSVEPCMLAVMDGLPQ